MNYYYPYFSMPTATARTGLKGLFGNIKWGSIISGTQKTLGVINQAIPLIKQAKPVINNAKTMFKVMNEFKKIDTPNITTPKVIENVNNESTIIEKTTSNSGPTFFA